MSSTEGKAESLVNREYKDRLFKFIFGNEKYKADLLQIYNALNQSNYTNPDDLEINTIEDVVYMKMKNDVSFIMQSSISLYEQQSTYCANMPLRGFMYFSKLYDQWLVVKGLNHALYGKRRIKIPAPQYYVFYNGMAEKEDCEYLRLSDAFELPVDGFEWTATMLNINHGHNKALLEQCETLRDYSGFVDLVRQKTNAYDGDVKKAVDEAVAIYKKGNGTLAEVLRKNEAEVKDMCLTEYDEEKTMDELRKEGKEEGIEEGIEVGRKEGIDIILELNNYLLAQNRIDDLKRATGDAQYREQLLKEIFPNGFK